MIRHIVVLDAERGIAKQGKQPWDLPADMAYFSQMTRTMGGVILMGRKTFEAIGRALPGRHNIVLTRQQNFHAPDVEVVHDIQTVLDAYEDIWVVGGAKLFELTLSLAGELYITEINSTYACDTFYPEYKSGFQLTQSSGPISEQGVQYSFTIYTPGRP